MDVQILSTEMIKPSLQTPHHLRNYKLSFLDLMPASFYIPLVLFYNTKFDLLSIPEIHRQLKKSLSDSLTFSYPFAGRFQDMLTVDCNDEGVLYKEAMASITLSEFLQKPNFHSLNKFLPRNSNVLEDSLEVQMSILVTVLSCGGLVIGACLFHRIADFTTMAYFLRTWADCFGGTGDKEVKDYEDLTLLRSSLFPPLSSIPDDYERNSNAFYFDGRNCSLARMFVFDASSIATLRAKATSKSVPNPSRVEVLTCFITERLMAGLESRSEKPPRSLMISHVVNIRRRLDPPLPDDAFGNLVWLVSMFHSLSEQKMELPEYVEMLREVLQGVNGESLRELEPENAIHALSESQRMIHQNDEVKIYRFTSWCNMGPYDLDFGWEGQLGWLTWGTAPTDV